MKQIRIETPLAESGIRTLLVNGIYFHSKYDPVREAERTAAEISESHAVILFSPGLGYSADIIRNKTKFLFLIERHEELAKLRPDLEMIIFPDSETIQNIIFSIEDLTKGKLSIVSGTYLDEDHDYYSSLRHAAETAVDELATHVITFNAFESVWRKNLIENESFIRSAEKNKTVSWITELDGAFRNRTIFILSAGPSLDKDLEFLAGYSFQRTNLKRNAVVIAVDSALKSVLHAGVIPDYVCSVDPQKIKASSLDCIGDIPLLASVLSPNEILKKAKKIYLFGQGHPLEEKFFVKKDSVMSDIGGSVATAAAVLALRFGAKCIVLVGQDLALTEKKMYSRGNVQEEEKVSRSTRFCSAENCIMSLWRQRNLRRVQSVDGNWVMTTPVLDSYRLHFEKIALENPQVRFIQTSMHGAKIGIEHIPISKLLEMLSKGADRNE
ncbi:MAG: hypothetical protein AUJ18_04145 [Candidatus Hydrogenedentes bacterium CG1_02_42_14]|nr:MAG: hypothetical protein AUJ18_04145 [Candidatus Hydrogenedentes bacterium CG1_02_42_14]